jgi:hypothetical protein
VTVGFVTSSTNETSRPALGPKPPRRRPASSAPWGRILGWAYSTEELEEKTAAGWMLAEGVDVAAI